MIFNRRTLFFLLLSFIEGCSVMAAELMGAKMMAPFFGSSLYVWSAVMAVTLGGLACGYFAGGIISEKKNPERNLYLVLLFAAVFTMMMPFLAQLSFAFFGERTIIVAVICSSGLLLFPPVFLMGMVSPLIIANVSSAGMHAGRASGTVYAISTVGGIITTFLFGFYIIPEFGLEGPALVTGIVLGILPFIMLIKLRSSAVMFFLFAAVLSFNSVWTERENKSQVKVVYSSEGLLGQIIVVDIPNEIYYGDSARKGQYSRWLYVNRISQTMFDPYAAVDKGEEKYFTYIYKIAGILDTANLKGKKILLLGLGGGSVANYFTEKGYDVDACELDKRIHYVAKNYFNLSPAVNVVIDDARHYLNITNKKYDVIIFDTFKGEETPSHMITRESLAKVKSLLNERGMFFINSFGYWKNQRGRGMQSIYRTLVNEGIHTRIIPTHPNEDQRNLVFVAAFHPITEKHPEFLITGNDWKTANILTDKIPAFEKLNSLAALSWRRASHYDRNLQELEIFH